MPALLLYGCKSHTGRHSGSFATLGNDSTLPALVCLDTLQSSAFVPTLENQLPQNKNVVYTPAFLYAWNELRESSNGPLKVPAGNTDLQLVNTSESYKGTLSPDEYATSVYKNGNSLRIWAAFKKGLPFKDNMDTSENGFKFNGTSVKAFGMPHFSDKITERINILYYENDDTFIISITPKDEREEIILAKGFNTGDSFKDVLQQIKQSTLYGEKERTNGNSAWKYYLSYEDVVLIPIMRFNYAANYYSIVNQIIVAGNDELRVDTAKQRNAFVIDEHGAKVESEATIAVSAAAAPPPPPGENEKPHIKKILLDKEFVILLKKKTTDFPYFMMRVNNTDIMVKR